MLTDWPTETTHLWLVLGLLCLAWTLWQVFRSGPSAMLSLACLFVWALWAGYHLTPWLALSSGVWDGYLLRPQYIDDGIAHSTLAMIAFILGYRLRFRLPRQDKIEFVERLTIHLPVLRGAAALTAVALLGLTIYQMEGIQNFLQADFGRGHGQWDERTFEVNVRRAATVIARMLCVVLALLASLIFVHPRRRASDFLLSLFLLLLSTAPLAANFSRASGLSLLVLVVISLALRNVRFQFRVLPIAALGFYMCYVGYNERPYYNPGIVNFAEAMGTAATREHDEARSGESSGSFLEPGEFAFNALDAWTLRAWTSEWSPLSGAENLRALFGVLQPLPSGFFNLGAPTVGESLSEVMGRTGSTGITTPALGEVYYLFGHAGAVLFLVYGWICGLIDRRFYQRPTALLVLAKILIAAGFVTGLHNALRSMTRPLVYALALLFAAYLWRLVRPRAHAPLLAREPGAPASGART